MSKNIIDIVHFDWNSAIGDTIEEKYESLYVFISSQTDRLPQDGVVGILCGTTFCWLFEQSIMTTPRVMLSVNGLLVYKGLVSDKWQLWQDDWMSSGELLLFDDSSMLKINVDNLNN